MSAEVANALRAVRALICEPGTWTTRTLYRRIKGKDAYCIQGAIEETPNCQLEVEASLINVLAQRYKLGTLPVPTCGPSGSPPIPWDHYLLTETQRWTASCALAQFNNSTSQAEVLALLDEAIANEDPPRLPTEGPENPQPIQEPEGSPVDDEGKGSEDGEGPADDGEEAAVQHRILELA